jgi:hypothetical protein
MATDVTETERNASAATDGESGVVAIPAQQQKPGEEAAAEAAVPVGAATEDDQTTAAEQDEEADAVGTPIQPDNWSKP